MACSWRCCSTVSEYTALCGRVVSVTAWLYPVDSSFEGVPVPIRTWMRREKSERLATYDSAFIKIQTFIFDVLSSALILSCTLGLCLQSSGFEVNLCMYFSLPDRSVRPIRLCVIDCSTAVISYSRYRWPRGVRRRSAAERLLGSRVRIPLRAWMFVLYSVCVVR
jgi:hypothetical protein